MWFGWGNRHKIWDLANGETLVCAYQYFHIFWVLGFTSGKRWFVQGDRRSEDRELTKDQVYELLGEIPKVGYYHR